MGGGRGWGPSFLVETWYQIPQVDLVGSYFTNLQIRGATVSPGYVGEDGRPQLSSVRSLGLKLKGLCRGVDQG